MSFTTPSTVVPTSDERELMLRFLHRQREEVVATAETLTEEQARWTPEGHLLPIIGVINHLTHVEQRWIDGRYLQHEFPPREEEFLLDVGVPLVAVISGYRERAERTAQVVRDAPNLEVPCLGREGDRPPAHALLGLSEPVDLRWVLLHLIEETAHHAGHADATRELLDGRKMRAD
jgi:dipeptidyl aminopeptidase/acylaminoacyl peptidase